MENLKCFYCQQNFDTQQKTPRLFTNCGHNYCTPCIEEMMQQNDDDISCPIDKLVHPIYTKQKGLKCFPINNQILTFLIEMENGQIIERCSEHGKILELVCKTDNTNICSDCVLFGNHAGHKYLKQDIFIQEIQSFLSEHLKKIEEERNALNNCQKNTQISIDKFNKKINQNLQDFIELLEKAVNKLKNTLQQEQKKKQQELLDIQSNYSQNNESKKDQLDQLQNSLEKVQEKLYSSKFNFQQFMQFYKEEQIQDKCSYFMNFYKNQCKQQQNNLEEQNNHFQILYPDNYFEFINNNVSIGENKNFGQVMPIVQLNQSSQRNKIDTILQRRISETKYKSSQNYLHQSSLIPQKFNIDDNSNPYDFQNNSDANIIRKRTNTNQSNSSLQQINQMLQSPNISPCRKSFKRNVTPEIPQQLQPRKSHNFLDHKNQQQRKSVASQNFLNFIETRQTNSKNKLEEVNSHEKGHLQLENLNLIGKQLTDEDLKSKLKQLSNKNFRKIILSKNKISYKGFEYIIRFVQKQENVQELDVSDNQIGNFAINLIQRNMHKLNGLKKINLRNCNIINSGQLSQIIKKIEKKGIQMIINQQIIQLLFQKILIFKFKFKQ